MKITYMEVLPVIEFNQHALAKFKKACSEWRPEQGGFPNVAFYVFYDGAGNQRKNGFVASVGDAHYWRPTKKGAIEAVHNNHSEKVR